MKEFTNKTKIAFDMKVMANIILSERLSEKLMYSVLVVTVIMSGCNIR